MAIHPPAEVSEALRNALTALTLPPHRLTPIEQVHLTLQFVGNTSPRDVETVVESVARSASGLPPAVLTPQCLVVLPARGPARVVAARTDAPATVVELKRRLAVRLARSARRDAADRFLPHLTLCRLRTPTRMSPPPDVPLAVAPFEVREIRVMRSLLSAEGARHVEVRAVALG